MPTTSADRILSLDVIRGIAVMGIFSVNVVGMSLFDDAYFYPPMFGFDGLGDKIMWAANFIIVDGRFRALFSILFGASMILVIERGIAAGRRASAVHFPRMIVLLAFGLAHYYLLWWGDILANYALVGSIAFMFWRLSPRHLMLAGILVLVAYYGPKTYFGVLEDAKMEAMMGPGATSEQQAFVAERMSELTPSAQDLATAKADHASIPAHVSAMLRDHPLRPFNSVPSYGLETLGLMLLGMAGYKGGFLVGSWSRRAYKQVAAWTLVPNFAVYSYATWLIFAADFAPGTYFVWDQTFVGWLHPMGAIGYAALIMLVMPHRGALVDRLAAVGRTAFTNYIGATLIGTMLFFGIGFGLYGEVSRGESWLFVPFVWAVMLLWSKPWLERFRYGPFEWAWRSLSRWRWEPMRKRSEAPLQAAA